MESEIVKKYGDRLRLRVCGMCWKAEKLLVVNHEMNTGKNFWAPVGGGVDFGESVLDALVREFREEANIQVQPGRFLFGCEYIKRPLHAVELFFEVFHNDGVISLGKDPESKSNHQILKDIRYKAVNDLMALNPDERHGIFSIAKTAEELKKLSGFYII